MNLGKVFGFDKKQIVIIILFCVFIIGFVSSAFAYAEKEKRETDDGRLERRTSEDAQIEYERMVMWFYVSFLVGVIGFILFFEMARFHWIEIGKKLARFEFLHDMEVKKKAVEEIRIQTIIHEEEEAMSTEDSSMVRRLQEKAKITGREKRGSQKPKKLKKEIIKQPIDDLTSFNQPLNHHQIPTAVPYQPKPQPERLDQMEYPSSMEPPTESPIISPETTSNDENSSSFSNENPVEDEIVSEVQQSDISTSSISLQANEMNPSNEIESASKEEQPNDTRLILHDAEDLQSNSEKDGGIITSEKHDAPSGPTCPSCMGASIHKGTGYFRCNECGNVWSG
jgi:hypothetical protein